MFGRHGGHKGHVLPPCAGIVGVQRAAPFIQRDASGKRRLDPQDRPQQGGLSCAIRAKHNVHATRAKGGRDGLCQGMLVPHLEFVQHQLHDQSWVRFHSTANTTGAPRMANTAFKGQCMAQLSVNLTTPSASKASNAPHAPIP